MFRAGAGKGFTLNLNPFRRQQQRDSNINVSRRAS